MNQKTALALSKCHRPAKPALQDPQVHKAVRIVEADPALKGELADQIAFDDRQAALIAAVKPGDAFLGKIDATLEHLDNKGFQWSALTSPPFLAAIMAILVVVGALVWWGPEWMQDFPGRDNARQLIDSTLSRLPNKPGPAVNRMEKKTAAAGDLTDWYFNKGYENFHILPEFAAAQTTSCGTFKLEGHSGAILFFSGKNSDFPNVLYVFPAQDFGIRVDPPDRWRYFQQGEWAVAVRADEDACVMVAVRGDKSDVQEYLEALAKAAPAPAK